MRIYCKDCKKKITLNGKKEKKQELLKCHLNRWSHRMIEHESGISKKTTCSYVNAAAIGLICSNELTRLLQPQNYSGTLQVDGKWISVKRKEKVRNKVVEITFKDYWTHDIPFHILAESENMAAMEEGFRFLKEIGYPLKILVCDESMGEIAQVAKRFFPEVKIQLCLIHYYENVKRTLKVSHIIRRIEKCERQLKYMNDAFLVPTRPYTVNKAIGLINQIADLENEYHLLISFQKILKSIFWNEGSMEEINQLEDEMNELIARAHSSHDPYLRRMVKRYHDYYDKRDRLLIFAENGEVYIPHTTNLIEGYHSTHLEIRLSGVRGFELEETAEAYINALVLFRRFKKFTDCKGRFKHLNGFSPLQAAQPMHDFGFNLNSKNWISFCSNLKQNPPS